MAGNTCVPHSCRARRSHPCCSCAAAAGGGAASSLRDSVQPRSQHPGSLPNSSFNVRSSYWAYISYLVSKGSPQVVHLTEILQKDGSY